MINDRVQEFMSGMMGRCAVPLFYMISGYLFFLKVPEGMTSIYGKMMKRGRTLVVPYIIGCLFFVGFGVLMTVLPGVSKYMNSSVMPLFQSRWENSFVQYSMMQEMKILVLFSYGSCVT